MAAVLFPFRRSNPAPAEMVRILVHPGPEAHEGSAALFPCLVPEEVICLDCTSPLRGHMAGPKSPERRPRIRILRKGRPVEAASARFAGLITVNHATMIRCRGQAFTLRAHCWLSPRCAELRARILSSSPVISLLLRRRPVSVCWAMRIMPTRLVRCIRSSRRRRVACVGLVECHKV